MAAKRQQIDVDVATRLYGQRKIDNRSPINIQNEQFFASNVESSFNRKHSRSNNRNNNAVRTHLVAQANYP